jgi:hypothetical protein
MPHQTTARRQGEQGQVLVLAALLLVVLILALGLVIDTSYAYAQRVSVQNAADAAALAGARELAIGSGQVLIWDRIAEYAVQRNGATDFRAVYLPGQEPIERTVGSPPSGANGVSVTAWKDYTTFFMVWGDNSVRVGARALAEVVPTQCLGGYAIWADARPGDAGVSDATVSGSGADIRGRVHSNDDLDANGAGHTFNGLVGYVDRLRVVGAGHRFIPSAGNPQQVPPAPRPVEYHIQDYRPGGAAAVAAQQQGRYHYHPGNWREQGAGFVVQEGLHFVDGNVHLSGAGLRGTVTIVATGNIELTGAGNMVTAYSDGLLFFANAGGNNAVKIAGAGTTWRGVIYAPNGEIATHGAGLGTLHGSLIGRAVTITGSGNSVYYDPGYCPIATKGPQIRLTE